MDHIKALTSALLVIIPIGATARIIYCLTVKNMDSDEEKSYDVRIRNILIFTVVAESIAGLLTWASSYFIQ